MRHEHICSAFNLTFVLPLNSYPSHLSLAMSKHILPAIILFLGTMILLSCREEAPAPPPPEEDPPENVVKGCMDTLAFNFDPDAVIEGFCQYSSAIFYSGEAGKYDSVGNLDLFTEIEIYIDDELHGVTTGILPQGSHNTSCAWMTKGLQFKHLSPDTFQWRAIIRYESGDSSTREGGILLPVPGEECYFVEAGPK